MAENLAIAKLQEEAVSFVKGTLRSNVKFKRQLNSNTTRSFDKLPYLVF
jgi:hypothetical protein